MATNAIASAIRFVSSIINFDLSPKFGPKHVSFGRVMCRFRLQAAWNLHIKPYKRREDGFESRSFANPAPLSL